MPVPYTDPQKDRTMRFTRSTAELIGDLRLSDSTLYRLRQEGVLKPGEHFRAGGAGSRRSPLQWDPAATEKALAARARRTQR